MNIMWSVKYKDSKDKEHRLVVKDVLFVSRGLLVTPPQGAQYMISEKDITELHITPDFGVFNQSGPMNPYSNIRYVTNTGEPIVGFVVCKGDLSVSTGKQFTFQHEARAYAHGLCDGGYHGPITIRYIYQE